MSDLSALIARLEARSGADSGMIAYSLEGYGHFASAPIEKPMTLGVLGDKWRLTTSIDAALALVPAEQRAAAIEHVFGYYDWSGEFSELARSICAFALRAKEAQDT